MARTRKKRGPNLSVKAAGKTKAELSAEIGADVEAFLAAGGAVHDVQPEECAWYRDKMRVKDKSQGASPDMRRYATSGGVAMSIHNENRLGAAPAPSDHVWRRPGASAPVQTVADG